MDEEGGHARPQDTVEQLRAYQALRMPTLRVRDARGKFGDAVRRMYALAARGDADALYHVGVCHLDGLGTPADADAAAKVLAQAAAAAHPKAQFLYGTVLYGRRLYKEAAAQFRAGARRGEPDAQYYLALCAADVIPHHSESARLFCAAANQGHQSALDAIRRWMHITRDLEVLFVIGRDFAYACPTAQAVYAQSAERARRAALCWMWTRALPQHDAMRFIGKIIYSFRADPEAWGVESR
jgi:TPR repeat protein